MWGWCTRRLAVEEALAAFQCVPRWEYWGSLSIRHFFSHVLAPLRSDPRYAAVLRAIDASWGVPAAGRGTDTKEDY